MAVTATVATLLIGVVGLASRPIGASATRATASPGAGVVVLEALGSAGVLAALGVVLLAMGRPARRRKHKPEWEEY